MAQGLSNLSDDELVAENQKLMRERDEIRAKQIVIQDALSERATERLLEGFSAEQIKSIQAVAAKAQTRKGDS